MSAIFKFFSRVLGLAARQTAEAIMKQDIALLQEILHRDAQLVHARHGGVSMLDTAVASWEDSAGDEIIALLLSAGAEVNAQDKKGWASLHMAASLDKAEAVRALISSGANPNIVSAITGDTPLHIAAYRESPKTASVLLECGANVDSKNKDGFTPLHMASLHGHDRTADVLLAHGADMDAQVFLPDFPEKYEDLTEKQKAEVQGMMDVGFFRATPFKLAWRNSQQRVVKLLSRRTKQRKEKQ